MGRTAQGRIALLMSFAFLCFICRSLQLDGSGQTNKTSTERGQLSVGFIYNTPPTDFGWNFGMDRSRLKLDKLYSRKSLRTYFEVIVDDSDMTRAIRSLVNRFNCSLIFVTVNSSNYSLAVSAAEFPQIHFVMINGNWSPVNVNRFFLRTSDCFYPLGYIAARMSLSGNRRSAIILTGRASDSMRAVNGFITGARQADPEHILELYIIPDKSEISTRKLTSMLAARNLSFIVGVMRNDQVARAVKENNRYTFSYPEEMGRTLYGEGVVSGCTVDWSPGLLHFIEREKAGIWNGDYIYDYGWQQGGVTLAPFSTLVDDQTADVADQISNIMTNATSRCLFSRETLEANGLLKNFTNSDFDSTGCLLVRKLLSFTLPFQGVIDMGEISEDLVTTPVFVDWNSASGVVLTVVVVFCSLVILLSIFFVFCFRKRVIIAATNQFFCYCILVGSIIGYLSILLWIGKPQDGICLARIWFLDLSSCFIFGSIAAKTYRIWRLWTHPDLRETSRSGQFIFSMIGVLACMQMILLSILTGLRGYRVSKGTDPGLKYDEYFLSCDLTSDGVIIVALILATNGIVIFICGVLAYVSKNVSQKYNETSSIVLSIYSIIVAATISLLLFINIQTPDPRQHIIFIATGVFIAVTCPLISIFGPKFSTIFKEYSFSTTPSDNKSSTSHQSSSLYRSDPIAK